MPSFKVIFFQIDKDIKKNEWNKFEGVTRSIEKCLEQAHNRTIDNQKHEDADRNEMKKTQRKIFEMVENVQKDLKKVMKN